MFYLELIIVLIFISYFSFLLIKSCILPGLYKFSLKPRNTPEIAGFYFLNAFWSVFQSGYVTLEVPWEFRLQPWDSTNCTVQGTVLRSASHPYQVPHGCCPAPGISASFYLSYSCHSFHPPFSLLCISERFVLHTGPFRQSFNFIAISCSAFYFIAIHSGHFLELYTHFLSLLSLLSSYVWSLKANFLGKGGVSFWAHAYLLSYRFFFPPWVSCGRGSSSGAITLFFFWDRIWNAPGADQVDY